MRSQTKRGYSERHQSWGTPLYELVMEGSRKNWETSKIERCLKNAIRRTGICFKIKPYVIRISNWFISCKIRFLSPVFSLKFVAQICGFYVLICQIWHVSHYFSVREAFGRWFGCWLRASGGKLQHPFLAKFPRIHQKLHKTVDLTL